MLRLAWFTLRAISAFNRVLLRRLTTAGRVLAGLMVGAAVIGIDTERSTTYQVFVLAGAFFLVAAPFLLRSRPHLEVSRILPPFATVDRACAYRMRLLNRGTRTERDLIVEETIFDPRPTLEQFLRAGPAPGARSFVERHSGYARWRRLLDKRGNVRLAPIPVEHLPPQQMIELGADFTPTRRGVLRFEAVTLARPDPFGLVKACRDVPLAQSVCVLPRRYRVPPLALPGSRRFQQGGVALATSVGDSEEFVCLREYRPGDPLKRVHWRSFARLGEPVVKEYQDEFFERHCLVLDTFVSLEREAAFEEAVSVAASFVCAIDTHDCLLDLMFVGERPIVLSSGRGMLASERLLELLAAAQPTGERAFAELAAAVLGRRAELSSAIVVFSQWDDARHDLCRRLIALGVPLLAIVVVAPGEAPANAPVWLKAIEVGRVEQDLARAFL
jgi:hypothetical protein